MKLNAALHRCLVRANVPGTLLLALLQRTPWLRFGGLAEDAAIASPAGDVLRSSAAAAIALGVLDARAGATSIQASPASLTAPAGQPITGVGFTGLGTEDIGSWQVVSVAPNFPAGLNFSGLTAPGVENDGSGTATLTGTPTVPGTYVFDLIAWEDPNASGLSVEGFYTVTITPPQGVAPAFALPASPSAATIAAGRTFVLNAIATGTPRPTLQWTLNGSTAIPGATVTNDGILVVTSATPANTGTYTCTATNSAGSASSSATLTVTASSNPGYLTNLSGRGVVGLGLGNGLFAGFGISGTGSKQLLIRGIGPGLLVPYPAFVGYLPDPSLTLYDNTPAVIATNDNWGGGSTLVNAQLAVGAYALPSNSLDAMLYFPEPASSYSAEVSGNNSTTGISVVELYDADTASPLPAKLINVSVRAPVGTGGNILFGGFTIGGATSETVLIRAIGPGFPPSFGLGGVALQQPVLTLFAGITPIYSNTVWGGDPALATAMSEVGAYPLAANTQDSLLLVTLPPGGYSAEVSGVNGTAGIAAVEIYEVP